jgi:hypothetical protein
LNLSTAVRCCASTMLGAISEHHSALSNYSLERAVKAWRVGAAGAAEIIAPAAPGKRITRPA